MGATYADKAEVGFVGSSSGYGHWIDQGRCQNSTEFLGQRWSECFDRSISFIQS
jgi:hypothetical protein